MKRFIRTFILTFIASLLILFLVPAHSASLPPLETQQKRAEQVLWYEQKVFGLDQVFTTIVVLRSKDMKAKDAWGSMTITPGGPVIEIMALQDYQPGLTIKELKHQQDEIVIHELLHVLLTSIGVPQNFQDAIIESVRPGVKLP